MENFKKSFSLEIVQGDRVLEYNTVYHISLKTPEGSLGILADRLPLVASLSEMAEITSDKGVNEIRFKDGIFIFQDNKARMVVKEEQ